MVPEICIIDYGMGNLRSVINALEYSVKCKVSVSRKSNDFEKADILVLPGVGAFSDAMKSIHDKNLFDELNKQVLHNKKPLLAICLGMQLVMNSSEEGGKTNGFGWIPGEVNRFSISSDFRVPHMGWDNVEIKSKNNLFLGIEDNPDFYFVHSYHVDCDRDYVVATCDYGGEFVAAIAKDNIIAFQFHPEKSHKNGLLLLSNYVNDIKTKLQC